MNAAQRRFVILEHDHPFLHWDFLLESNGVALTWRLLQRPNVKVWIPAEALPEHRLLYLDYEGPVSAGRGRVSRVDSGTFWPEEPYSTALGEWSIQLRNSVFASRAILRQLSDPLSLQCTHETSLDDSHRANVMAWCFCDKMEPAPSFGG